MPSARGVHVPRANHPGVTPRPPAPTDTTATDCDLHQTLHICSISAIGSHWHCRSLAHQCSVPPDGTYKHHIGICCK